MDTTPWETTPLGRTDDGWRATDPGLIPARDLGDDDRDLGARSQVLDHLPGTDRTAA